MEDNVILTREEFAEFIKIKVRVEVLEDVIAKEGYVSTASVCAILGIEVKNNG